MPFFYFSTVIFFPKSQPCPATAFSLLATEHVPTLPPLHVAASLVKLAQIRLHAAAARVQASSHTWIDPSHMCASTEVLERKIPNYTETGLCFQQRGDSSSSSQKESIFGYLPGRERFFLRAQEQPTIHSRF